MLLVGCLIVYTPLRIVRITRFLENTVHQKNKSFFPYIKKDHTKNLWLSQSFLCRQGGLTFLSISDKTLLNQVKQYATKKNIST